MIEHYYIMLSDLIGQYYFLFYFLIGHYYFLCFSLSDQLPAPIPSMFCFLVSNYYQAQYVLFCSLIDQCYIPDPEHWSVDDVRKWLVWQAEDYCPQRTLELQNFQMNGHQLCCMNEEDFKLRTAEGGTKLYAQLDVWKNGKAIIIYIYTYVPVSFDLRCPSIVAISYIISHFLT